MGEGISGCSTKRPKTALSPGEKERIGKYPYIENTVQNKYFVIKQSVLLL
jgi:hypothetical protein